VPARWTHHLSAHGCDMDPNPEGWHRVSFQSQDVECRILLSDLERISRAQWSHPSGVPFIWTFLPGVSAALRRPGYLLPTLRVGLTTDY